VPVAIGASSFIFAASHLLPSEVPALTLLGVILASTSIIGNVSERLSSKRSCHLMLYMIAIARGQVKSMCNYNMHALISRPVRQRVSSCVCLYMCAFAFVNV